MQTFFIITGILIIIVSFILFLATDSDDNLLGIPIGILILLLSLAFNTECNNNTPNIILPEEYKLIRETDTLKGYYDSKGTLHIEFNNKRNNQ